MTHVNCRLTGKNRDQLRNPTLGNRVWATFTILAAILEGTWLLPAYGSLVTVAVVYETRLLPATVGIRVSSDNYSSLRDAIYSYSSRGDVDTNGIGVSSSGFSSLGEFKAAFILPSPLAKKV